MIDSHCHLDAPEFDVDRNAAYARARAAGVNGIVIPAVERANFGAVASLCREYEGCYPAYGIHPMYVARAEEGDLQALRETLQREHAVAVGEIGLDNFIPDPDVAKQTHFFVEQLKIAREFELPVILHVRKSSDQILRELRKYKPQGLGWRGIAHAFNGSQQQAEEFIKLGFKLGFGGAMTWGRALKIRELAATLPLESIVLETDSPDIPPEWLSAGPGKYVRNEPAELPKIAAVLAALRGISLAEVSERTIANTHAALKIAAGVQE
jgi:TatD DNase family protein